ncbi:MAG: hypothetical protein HY704_05135 [Gemmatimonadetes bacterium]|nr:hypothetical protein [Gemmatimonadota bacterium]
MTEFYRAWFPRVTAARYAGGAMAHVARVFVGLPLTEMPFLDWIVGLASRYGGLGFWPARSS